MHQKHRKYATIVGVVLGVAAILVLPAMANVLSGAGATADCNGYTLTVSAIHLDSNIAYEIDYSFMLTCNGSSTVVPGKIFFTTTNNGSSTDNSATETVVGTWPSGPLSANCTATGSAILTSSGSTFAITINGSATATLACGTTTGGGKSFSIGPSSMEGDLHISPGDWISGGYNFKFTDNHHGATAYTVTATVTVPVVCPDNSVDKIVIPLGQPGALDGGGVTSFTYNIAAGDTNNHPTNDQNSILAWSGAVQAPPTLCGGAVGRNQSGAVFNATVSQNPQVGLADWQFHYRDPNAKGKGNVDCTDASNPRRNDAATCGASWSPTLRDP
jgi:hypothetical protein